MTRTQCPFEAELSSFVDHDLPPERADRQRAHLLECAACRREEERLRTMIADVRAPLAPAPAFDVRAHVEGVMARLDRPQKGVAWPRARSLWLGAGAGSLAVALTLVLYLAVRRAPDPVSGTWQARGGAAASSIAREVGVWPCAIEGAPRRLGPGATIGRDTPLSAIFRNAGQAPAFLLLFAVDARGDVHWISPAYERAAADPPSTMLPAGAEQRLLSTTAVLDGVPAGPLRIVAVIGREPARVSDVERLGQPQLDARGIASRFAGAEVRETLVQVRGPAAERPEAAP
jgi:hypothetical protein